MLKKEWQAILKHKFFIIVIIALALVPAIYNYIFLGSMWDPYGKLNDLPVAVVNLDKTSELNGKKFKLGDDVIAEMKKSKDLDYHFVSEDKASKGIKKGDYYMVITFPENFSENATTLMNKKPKTVQLDYQTTRGHNYISSKMSESAMNQLKSEVSKNITETYTKEIFAKLGDMKSGMKEASDGSNKLADGTSSALNGSKELSSNLNTLSSSSLTFTDGANNLNSGLNKYVSGVNQAANGGQQLSSGADQFVSGTQQLAAGTQTLADKSKDLQSGTMQLVSGLSQLQANGSTLTSGSNQLAGGAQQISSGSQQLANGGSSLTSGLGTLNTGANNLSTALTKADDTLSATNNSNENAKKVAAPLKLKHTDHDNVPENGAGMTPYMINVALFIGALATNVVIGIGFSGEKCKSGREFMLAKIGTNGLVALLQGIIVWGAVALLGLRPNHLWEMLLSVLLISFAYMAINTFFLTALGKIGEFLMIVVLVLQLATSAGTYPLQLAPKIYQVISPWLPMTYGLKMLRETIGLNGAILPEAILFVVIIALFTFMLSFFKKFSRFA